MAEPMAVPSSTSPIVTCSLRVSSSHSWSSVSGLGTYGRPAKATRPMRSLGRPLMKSRVTFFATVMRFTVVPSIVKSSMDIESETSMTMKISMPLALMFSWVRTCCGRASETMASASVTYGSMAETMPMAERPGLAISRSR